MVIMQAIVERIRHCVRKGLGQSKVVVNAKGCQIMSAHSWAWRRCSRYYAIVEAKYAHSQEAERNEKQS